MPEPAPRRKPWGRLAAAPVGLLFLSYLVKKAGPSTLLEGIASVGWGLALVIALAGLLHVLRTWAWRLTLPHDRHRPSFGRMLALRLTSEAAGQIGAFGQVCGDMWRVTKLGAELPLAGRIASVALDRALFTLSSTIVTIAAIASVAFLAPLPRKIAVFANIFGFVLVALVFVTVFAVRRHWAFLTRPAAALGRLGKIGRCLERRRETIQSVEDRLLDFFHHSPAAFWKSFALQIAGQVAALMEVYLILRLMGCDASLLAAVAIEGFTKLVNVVGLINPGNAGTYEGGNMLLAKLAGMGGTAGLTLGLIRRVRALFWAAAGAGCAVMLTDRRRQKPKMEHSDSTRPGHSAIVLAQGVAADSMLTKVGALPVLLRAILGAQKCGARRIFLVINPVAELRVLEELRRTRRLPPNFEWFADAAAALREVGAPEERIVSIAGDRTYHPSLHRRAAEWTEEEVLSFTCEGRPVGICALTAKQAGRVIQRDRMGTGTVDELHWRLTAAGPVVGQSVPSDQWQRVASPEDRMLAERKLDGWLVKPTDGVFARMNRRVSIPISRQIIKFPITPNMVSLFTLGVSFLAGVLFAFGDRWNMLLGAALSVFASILDGSDGEVARLKLQESAFGCWLETVCDYLYYVFIFAGMFIGLLRRGPVYRMWGAVLFFGAIASFLTIAAQRRRMAGSRPEQYLSLWQAQASRRRSNPFLYLGRHTEFLIRRCCMPYLFLGFALFGATYLAFIGAAVASNIVWPIALYSYFTLVPVRTSHE